MSLAHRNIVDILHKMLKKHQKEEISLGEVIDLLEDQSLILLIAITAFPMALPIPTPPGFTTLFGIPLCIFTLQLIMGHEKPWLPKWISNKKIKTQTFQHFVNKAEPLFEKISKLFKERYPKFLSPSSEKLMAVLAFLCSVSVALPILFGNAIPSAAILIMSLGMLYRDGLIVVIGMVVAVIGLTIASAVVFAFFLLGKLAFFQLFKDYL